MGESLVNGRYRIVREIGRGAQGSTHLARDEQQTRDVALKELDFAGVGSWDSVAVFEREIAVLGGLDHPNIPKILDSFRIEEADSLRMYLVQEFVEGQDLQRRLEAGELFDEPHLLKLAAAVLDILVYLHGNSPPVLHRDIKPANLVQRPDGSVALVDFGAAQGSQHGEAVIGTTGYMPAEQLMGRARPASDLFALGATLIQLATRKHPSDLGEGLGLKWREFANLSPRFSDWLDRMVAPMAEDRFPSALAAARALEERKKRKRAVASLDDKVALERRKLTETPNGRYKLRRSFARLSVEARKPVISPALALWSSRFLVGLVVIVLISTNIAHNLAVAGALLCLAALMTLLSRSAPGIRSLEGHDRGLDIVWAGGDEVVQRVLVEDIAGPDLERIAGQSTLVLWTRDGGRLMLDRQLGSGADARLMRAIIQAWLAEARRTR